MLGQGPWELGKAETLTSRKRRRMCGNHPSSEPFFGITNGTYFPHYTVFYKPHIPLQAVSTNPKRVLSLPEQDKRKIKSVTACNGAVRKKAQCKVCLDSGSSALLDSVGHSP